MFGTPLTLADTFQHLGQLVGIYLPQSRAMMVPGISQKLDDAILGAMFAVGETG